MPGRPLTPEQLASIRAAIVRSESLRAPALPRLAHEPGTADLPSEHVEGTAPGHHPVDRHLEHRAPDAVHLQRPAVASELLVTG